MHVGSRLERPGAKFPVQLIYILRTFLEFKPCLNNKSPMLTLEAGLKPVSIIGSLISEFEHLKLHKKRGR